MTETTPFSRITRALLEEAKPFPAQYLHRFSDLAPEDVHSVLEVWSRVPLTRKQALLEDLEVLAESDSLMCFDALARALLSDQDAGVRLRAIHLLWECEDLDLAPFYVRVMESDEDVECRAAAASALGSFIYRGELEEIPSALLHEVEERLLAAAREAASPIVRRHALEALGASSRSEIPSLIQFALQQKETDWIASALFAMGRSSDEQWEKIVLAHIFDQEERVRLEAIRAAGKLSLSSARTPLLDLLDDEEDPEIHREIVWALSSIGGEGIRARIEELCEMEADDEDLDFYEEALENLLFTEDLNQFDLLEIDLDEGNETEDIETSP